MDEAELRYRAGTIGASMVPTHALCGFGWLYAALTWSEPHRPFIALLFGLGILSQLALARRPPTAASRAR